MAGDIIKMNRAKMDAMSQAFRTSGQTVQEVTAEMQKVAQMLSEGALLGEGGNALAEVVGNNLVQVLNRIREKFEELDGDILVALDEMYGADSDTAGLY